MNLQAYAHRNYEQTLDIRPPREVEYEIFSRVTAKLRAAAQPEASAAQLCEALEENRKLWMALTLDLGSPENGLPSDLRAKLLYLAQFSFEHSIKVQRGSETPEALVDVNTAVMRGLMGGGAE